MRSYLFLFFTVLFYCSTAAYGQITISSGTPYPMVEDGYDWVRFYEQNGELLAVKLMKEKVILQKFTLKDLTQTSIQTYDDFPKDRGLNFNEIREVNGKYYVFYYLYEPTIELDELYVREIDFNTGTFKDAGNKLITIKDKLRDINYVNSADGSKLLIRMSPKPDRSKRTVYQLGLYVFDQNLKPVWEKEVDIPFTNSNMEYVNEIVSSTGDVYQMRKVYEFDFGGKFYYDLVKIEAGTGKVSIESVKPGYDYRSPFVFEKKSGQVSCAGIYYNEAGRNGYFIADVDNEAHLNQTKTFEFSLELINQNEGSGKQKRNLKKPASAYISDLTIKEVIVEEDGSTLIVAEQYYMEDRSKINDTGSGMLINKDYIHHFDNIVAMKINASSAMDWAVKIPKRQRGRYLMGAMSYIHFQSEKKEYFYVVDVKSNNKLTTQKPKLFNNGPGILTLHSVDRKAGTVQRLPVAETENLDGVPLRRFMLTRLTGIKHQNYTLIENYKGKKKDYLVKITVPE